MKSHSLSRISARFCATRALMAMMLLFAAVSSVVVTLSYAQPGVHHESREVRVEERGELLNTTSSERLVQTADFNGVWDTVTSEGKKYVLTLRARGGVVRGSYQPSNGSIRGTQTGRTLRLTCSKKDGSLGAGRFIIEPDSQSFQGTFSANNNPDDTSGGTWNGTRQQ